MSYYILDLVDAVLPNPESIETSLSEKRLLPGVGVGGRDDNVVKGSGG